MRHFCSFSEAIREGAKLRPQTFDVLFKDGATCAFGAGLEGMGHSIESWDLDDAVDATEVYSYLRSARVACPADNCTLHDGEPRTIQDTLFDLNDVHRWTREQIADWLESEEEKLGYVTLTEPEPALEPDRVAGVRGVADLLGA